MGTCRQGDAALLDRDPGYGGNTLFASGYAAYETLDPDQAPSKPPRRHYNYGSTQRATRSRHGGFNECIHPVFARMKPGARPSINRLMTVNVIDMEPSESNRLLSVLFDHAERRESSTSVWRKGDLLLWDNRCSSHARTDFPTTERRLMLRTTVAGTTRPY
jgi:taurine dioxygenase